ncbi:MAG: hypothetical protein AAGF78_02930 [Pseudomonadota bacterium]
MTQLILALRACLYALLLSLPIAAASQQVTPTTKLGLAFPGSATKYYPVVRQAGIGIVRLTANWKLIEPRPGSYDFRGLDARVVALQNQGLVPFITFESPAGWYAKPGTGKTSKNAEPASMEQWATFVRLVVERYDGDGTRDAPGLRFGVRYFQAANEFVAPTNRSGGWDSSNSALLDYVNTAYSAAKGASKNTIFVMGGVASFNMDIALLAETGNRFLLQQRWDARSKTVFGQAEVNSPQVRSLLNDRFKYIIRNARYDWASVHLYGPENRDAARIAYMRKISGRKVLSTECGGPTLDYDPNYRAQDHASAVIERNLGILAEGLPFCLWLGLGEEMTTTYGNRRVPLYDTSRRPKPGVNAFRLLAQMLEGRNSRVTRLGSAGYDVRGDRGRFCVASGPEAAADLASRCGAGTAAVCWTGSGGSMSWSGRASDLAQNCQGAAVLIVGDGAKGLSL